MESNVQDAYKRVPGYVEGNDYALPYWSSLLTENNMNHDHVMFKHVNCSYLSTPGRPPTLAALKQHAQSIAFLITTLDPVKASGEIDNENAGDRNAKSFDKQSAFDWLNNLQVPYTPEDSAHHRPLNSLVNLVKANSDTKGVQSHCPLEHGHPSLVENSSDERQDHPYARHMNLLMHANECLEMLDHEYSATGGLMSILPSGAGPESEELKNAKQTLIGQWLLYTQQLVARMHDLELAYANSLDLIDGEAVIPMQHMSSQGPDGRAGREIIYPQDRWILANAGDEVVDFLHHALDRKEIVSDREAQHHIGHGVTGETLQTSDETERGIVYLDLATRYYRLKNGQRGPIFVLPAFSDRPSTKHTVDIEKRPTVVAVPAPTMPERLSEWEKRMRGHDRELAELRTEKSKFILSTAELTRDNERQTQEANHTREVLKTLRETGSEADRSEIEHVRKYQRQIQDLESQRDEAKKEIDELKRNLDDLMLAGNPDEDVAMKFATDAEGNVTQKVLRRVLDAAKTVSKENKHLRALRDDKEQGYEAIANQLRLENDELKWKIEDLASRCTGNQDGEKAATGEGERMDVEP